MSASSSTIAFIGATGGCANACLVLTLQAGYNCTALARTPTKLTEMLLAAGVPQSTIDAHLTITKGDIRDPASVQAVLAPSGHPVSTIISGIGMIFSTKMDTSICKDATKAIIDALDVLNPPQRPFMVVISTTGISKGPRDVSLALSIPYHTLLRTPHVDKKIMEQLVEDAAAQGKLSGFAAVRPSLLTSGEEMGMGKIRVGSEEKPAIGYTISRKDVGRYLYESCVKGDVMSLNGQHPSITH